MGGRSSGRGLAPYGGTGGVRTGGPPEHRALSSMGLGSMDVRPRCVPHGGGAGGRGGERGAGGGRGPALQPVEPGLQRPLVVVGGGQQDPGADQLHLEARRSGTAHLGEPVVDEVGGAAQLGGAEDGGLGLHALDDVGGRVDEPLLPRIRHGGEDHQVPQPLQEIGHEPTRIVAALDDPVHDLEGGGPVAGGEGVDDRVEQRAVGVAEKRGGHGIRHTVVARAGEQLVHDGHRVTHGPGPGAHDERKDAVLDRAVSARTPRRDSCAGCRGARAGTDSGAYATGSSR
ncbi:hypothetical protein SBADM41S_07565 [Streptomyces badius]